MKWYAIRVRSNAEQTTAAYLGSIGYEVFFPTYREIRKWSDRAKEVRVPLFGGYIFCQMNIENRLPLLQASGVVDIVGFGRQFEPVPDSEIEAVQRMVNSPAFARPYPFLSAGARVELRHGPLAGLEGILVQNRSDCRLVVSVNLLQRSVAVEVDVEWIRPVHLSPVVLPTAAGAAGAVLPG